MGYEPDELLGKSGFDFIHSDDKKKLLQLLIGIYYNDFTGKFLYGNRKAEEIIGYKSAELIGKSFLKLSLLAPKYLAKAAKILALNKLGKATGSDEFSLITKQGSEVNVEISTEVIRIEGRKVVLGMVQDVTDRKRVEREREKLILELREALNKVKTLSGLLPICASCKKIRDDKGYWNRIESYIHQHSEAEFTHSICSDCARKLYPNEEIGYDY